MQLVISGELQETKNKELIQKINYDYSTHFQRGGT